MLYYRDFLVIPGEDIAFVLSALWRALHAHQQRKEAKLVSVPVKYDRPTRRVMLAEKNELADGFRVFAQTEDELKITLDPHIEDAVQAKQIQEAQESQNGCIQVKRVYPKEVRMRYKKGEEFINNKWTLYLWHKKEDRVFVYYIHVSRCEEKCNFSSVNSFGCGTVPVLMQ